MSKKTLFDIPNWENRWPRYKDLGKKTMHKIVVFNAQWLDPERPENKWLVTGDIFSCLPSKQAKILEKDGWENVEIHETDPSDPKKNIVVKGLWSKKRQEFVRPARNPERVLEITASMGTLDRDKEIIEMAGWIMDDFRNYPAITWAHRTDQLLIGNAVRAYPDKEANKLKAWPEFVPGEIYDWAETCFRNYRFNWTRAWSVGFDGVEYELGDIEKAMKGEEPFVTYTKQKLVEIAGCGIGAHQSALTEAEKRHGEGGRKMLFSGFDPEDYQEEITTLGIAKIPFYEAFLEKRDAEHTKPLPHEHVCHLDKSTGWDRVRRKNCDRKHDGKCIDVIYGIKDDVSHEISLHFHDDVWTETQAKAYCKDHDGRFEAASGGKEESCLERIERKLDVLTDYFGSDIIPRLDRMEKRSANGGATEPETGRQTPEPNGKTEKNRKWQPIVTALFGDRGAKARTPALFPDDTTGKK